MRLLNLALSTLTCWPGAEDAGEAAEPRGEGGDGRSQALECPQVADPFPSDPPMTSTELIPQKNKPSCVSYSDWGCLL